MNFPRQRILKTPLISFSSCMSSSSNSTNHYDTLKVDQNATQEEIKTAYYKLTKQYHPDVNKTEDAKGKFRDVSEAYEILGNYKARKQYDRGMSARGTVRSTYKEYKEDPHMAFYKSRMDKYPKPIRRVDNQIYDFDAWTRAHYGKTFKRTIHRREVNKEAEILKDTNLVHHAEGLKDIQTVIGFILVIAFAIIFFEAKENFDIVVEKNEKEDKR